MTEGMPQYRSTQSVFSDGGLPLIGAPLRTHANFPDRRLRLLHLHGSLAWLRGPDGVVYRFDISSLRNRHYWKAWREGRTDWAPEVVLTNQPVKTSLVTQHPFSLAYRTFQRDLLTADKWLIVGYSLGDRCVNEMLTEAFVKRRSIPSVMFVGLGSQPSEDEILSTLGWDALWDSDEPPSEWLYIHREGVRTAAASSGWNQWSSTIGLAQAG